AFVRAERPTPYLLPGFDEVVESTGVRVRPLELFDAMRDPAHDERFHAVIPQRAVDRPLSHVNDVELLRGGRRLDLDRERGSRRGLAVLGFELEDVDARFAEG